MSARPGAGFASSRAWAASTMPGVQYPHCRACAWQNASCTGLSPPSSAGPLDRGDAVAVGLRGENEAGPDRLAVEQDGAAPADPVLAAEMRAGQVQLVA